MASGEELGAAFNIDVTSEAFWNSSLDVLRARIDEFEELSTTLGYPKPDDIGERA
jgi:oligoendopeptidase F